jgi:hypothetical protein
MDAYTGVDDGPTHSAAGPLIADLPALGIVVFITALVYVGIRESKKAANIMVAVKLAVILLVIILGAFYVNTANWHPFLPNGFKGVMTGVAAVFFAYIGFDALSTTAEGMQGPIQDAAPRHDLQLAHLYGPLRDPGVGADRNGELHKAERRRSAGIRFWPEGVNIPWISGIIAVSAIIAIATCCSFSNLANRVCGWQ